MLLWFQRCITHTKDVRGEILHNSANIRHQRKTPNSWALGSKHPKKHEVLSVFWEARWPAVAQTIGFYRCSKPRWPTSTVFQRQISGRLECRITCGNHWALLTPPRPLQLRAVWGFFNIIYGFVVLFIISDTFPPPRGSRNIFCSTQWPPLVPQ